MHRNVARAYGCLQDEHDRIRLACVKILSQGDEVLERQLLPARLDSPRHHDDLRAGGKLSMIGMSMIGNIFLSVSMIAQSLYLMRKSTRWGIISLTFSSAVLGFGLHALLRSLSK